MPLTARGWATRQHLLAVARGLFEQDGVDAVSINVVVQSAGVSRGTYYLSFSSKAALATSLVEDLRGECARIHSHLGADGRSAVESIRDALADYFAYYQCNGRLLGALDAFGTHSPEVRAAGAETRREVVAQVGAFIAEERAGGRLPPGVSPRYAAFALTAMAERFAFVWLVLDEEFHRESVVETLARLWYQAIGGGAVAPGSAEGPDPAPDAPVSR